MPYLDPAKQKENWKKWMANHPGYLQAWEIEHSYSRVEIKIYRQKEVL